MFSFLAVPPKWIREPQDVHAILGRDVVLNCEVEGYPRPTTLWTRANGKLPSQFSFRPTSRYYFNSDSVDFDIVCLVAIDFGVLNYQVLPLGLSYNQFPNGTLLISSVDKSAQGSYTCTAQNGVRSAITKTINVTVNGKDFALLFASLGGVAWWVHGAGFFFL